LTTNAQPTAGEVVSTAPVDRQRTAGTEQLFVTGMLLGLTPLCGWVT